MFDIKLKLHLTLSKAMGVFIAVSATFYGFRFPEQSNVMLWGWALGSALFASKNAQESIKDMLEAKVKMK